ncbi:MAG: hypothetical protein QGG36_12115 [Pirellulaceae bacterium]|jgi:hypothetical protein|nr:hypothetical protein [Pirellulaceae bacterium]MDP7016540.1 hypothetical protein [Pirellulaceae bacterium]
MRFTLQQWLVAAPLAALTLGSALRFYNRLGMLGLITLGLLFACFSVLIWRLVFNQRHRWTARICAVLVFGFAVPLSVLPYERYGGFAIYADSHSNSRMAVRVRREVAQRRAFDAVKITHHNPGGRCGAWLEVSGRVRTDADRIELEHTIADEYNWHVEWNIAVEN